MKHQVRFCPCKSVAISSAKEVFSFCPCKSVADVVFVVSTVTLPHGADSPCFTMRQPLFPRLNRQDGQNKSDSELNETALRPSNSVLFY